MANITCGKCKKTHSSVEEVKSCYAVKAPAPAEAYTPAALAPKPVPACKYAVDQGDLGIIFYEVKRPSTGKWAGFVFVDRLVGSPGDWMRYPVKGAAKAKVLAQIGADIDTAIHLFVSEYRVCAACCSPLTDEVSRARGLGPVCAVKVA